MTILTTNSDMVLQAKLCCRTVQCHINITERVRLAPLLRRWNIHTATILTGNKVGRCHCTMGERGGREPVARRGGVGIVQSHVSGISDDRKRCLECVYSSIVQGGPKSKPRHFFQIVLQNSVKFLRLTNHVSCLCFTRRLSVCLFVCLSVCLLVNHFT